MIEQPRHPHLTLLPSTATGRWSVLLALVSLGALVVFFVMAATGQTGGDTFSDNWLLAGPMFVTLIAGIAGLLTGLLALLRSGERGILLALPLLWGLVVTVQTLGEILMPH